MESMRRMVAGLALFVLGGCQGAAAPPAPMDMALPNPCSANPMAPGCETACTDDDSCLKDPDNPRCDVTTGLCVACLPQPDNCANGTVCQRVNGVWTCATSCTSDNECSRLGGGG